MKRGSVWGYGWLILVGAIATVLFTTSAGWAESMSSYSLSQQAEFNQPSYYPIATNRFMDFQRTQTELNDDGFSSTRANNKPYRPVAEWMGRLILPERTSDLEPDWVWLELYHAPDSELVGQVVRLEWGNSAFAQGYPDLVTTDVALSDVAYSYQDRGNVMPTRLDGRPQVGPLQSLAGTRPNDDVVVKLHGVTVVHNDENVPVLRVDQEPVQITGRWYGLVSIVESLPADGDRPVSADCPVNDSCQSDFFRVQHYNPQSHIFDGVEEIIRMPQQPRDRNGRFMSTPHQLATSPAGSEGWYIYGAYDADDVFTVQALKPRSLYRLQPDMMVLGNDAGRRYINQQNWHQTPQRKGTAQSVLVDPRPVTDSEAIAEWQEGDAALLIHLFGGIGGEAGESPMLWSVTGHYAYGVATVVREAIANELQFQITYQQIYAHNPNGIVAGSMDWTAYMGDLQRGWLGSRPVSDILVKLDALSRPFQFGSTPISVSVLNELSLQTQIIMARYRTGDGQGLAAVTPATSCVQDSSQALYITLERLKAAILADPDVVEWIETHPNDPETKRFQRVVRVGKSLESLLVPRNVVRPDWQNNAEYLAGISGDGGLGNQATLQNALLSWRSIMPRQAQDQISHILLNADAQLWFLRTNQVGGVVPSVVPIAPTGFLGQLPIVSNVLNRLLSAILTPLTGKDWMIVVLALILYGAIAIPVGFKTGFLSTTLFPESLGSSLRLLVRLLFLPALLEESVRVMLLPHPNENVTTLTWLIWASMSLILYILYHPINAATLYPAGNPTFFTPVFLSLTAGLGVTCTLVYAWTGSLLAIALIHWVVVSIWLLGFGGIVALGEVVKR